LAGVVMIAVVVLGTGKRRANKATIGIAFLLSRPSDLHGIDCILHDDRLSRCGADYHNTGLL
jgi:hypothetical protein